MKIVTVLALCALLFAESTAFGIQVSKLNDIFKPSQTNVEEPLVLRHEDFKAHLIKFELNYAEGFEYNTRLEVFSKNVAAIEKHNSESHSYSKKISQFTHLTNEEFAAYASMGRPKGPKPDAILEMNARMPVHYAPIASDGSNRKLAAAGAVDWRNTSGVVMPVKNQGQCGSCWTFSATGGMEGAYYVMKNSSASQTLQIPATMDAATGFYGLSEQDLCNCDGLSFGCGGGFVEAAFIYASQKNGLPSEKTYPYLNIPNANPYPCNNAKANTDYPGTVPDLDIPYTSVAHFDIAALEDAVSRQPISIIIQAGPTTPGGESPVQNYAGGIITLADGCAQTLDHAVLLVGYGRDTTLNMDYWIVKNSWGADWGDKGYFLVEKSSDNACGILNEPLYPNIMGASVLPTNAPTPPPTLPPTYYTVASIGSDNETAIVTSTSPPAYTATGIIGLELNLVIDHPTEFLSGPKSFPNLPLYTLTMLTQTDNEVYMGTGVTITNSQGSTSNYIFVMQAQIWNNIGEVRIVQSVGGKIPYTGPVNSLSVGYYAISMLQNSTSYLLNANAFVATNIKFAVDLNAPTSAPNTGPTPPPPVAITDTLTQSWYSDSSCTSAVVMEAEQAVGLCTFDSDSGTYQQLTHSKIIVVTPDAPVDVQFQVASFTDDKCSKMSGNPATFTLKIRECVYDISDDNGFPGGYYKYDLPGANGGNLADPLTVDPVGVAAYQTETACTTDDGSKAIFGFTRSSNMCQDLVIDGLPASIKSIACNNETRAIPTMQYNGTGCNATNLWGEYSLPVFDYTTGMDCFYIAQEKIWVKNFCATSAVYGTGNITGTMVMTAYESNSACEGPMIQINSEAYGQCISSYNTDKGEYQRTLIEDPDAQGVRNSVITYFNENTCTTPVNTHTIAGASNFGCFMESGAWVNRTYNVAVNQSISQPRLPSPYANTYTYLTKTGCLAKDPTDMVTYVSIGVGNCLPTPMDSKGLGGNSSSVDCNPDGAINIWVFSDTNCLKNRKLSQGSLPALNCDQTILGGLGYTTTMCMDSDSINYSTTYSEYAKTDNTCSGDPYYSEMATFGLCYKDYVNNCNGAGPNWQRNMIDVNTQNVTQMCYTDNVCTVPGSWNSNTGGPQTYPMGPTGCVKDPDYDMYEMVSYSISKNGKAPVAPRASEAVLVAYNTKAACLANDLTEVLSGGNLKVGTCIATVQNTGSYIAKCNNTANGDHITWMSFIDQECKVMGGSSAPENMLSMQNNTNFASCDMDITQGTWNKLTCVDDAIDWNFVEFEYLSQDCSGVPFSQVVSSSGLCERMNSTSYYQNTYMNGNFTGKYYLDSQCQTPDPNIPNDPPYQQLSESQCNPSDYGSHLTSEVKAVDNKIASVNPNYAGSAYFYPTKAACQAKDQTQVLGASGVTIGACIPILYANRTSMTGENTHWYSQMFTCGSGNSSITLTKYTDELCSVGMTVMPDDQISGSCALTEDMTWVDVQCSQGQNSIIGSMTTITYDLADSSCSGTMRSVSITNFGLCNNGCTNGKWCRTIYDYAQDFLVNTFYTDSDCLNVDTTIPAQKTPAMLNGDCIYSESGPIKVVYQAAIDGEIADNPMGYPYVEIELYNSKDACSANPPNFRMLKEIISYKVNECFQNEGSYSMITCVGSSGYQTQDYVDSMCTVPSGSPQLPSWPNPSHCNSTVLGFADVYCDSTSAPSITFSSVSTAYLGNGTTGMKFSTSSDSVGLCVQEDDGNLFYVMSLYPSMTSAQYPNGYQNVTYFSDSDCQNRYCSSTGCDATHPVQDPQTTPLDPYQCLYQSEGGYTVCNPMFYPSEFKAMKDVSIASPSVVVTSYMYQDSCQANDKSMAIEAESVVVDSCLPNTGRDNFNSTMYTCPNGHNQGVDVWVYTDSNCKEGKMLSVNGSISAQVGSCQMKAPAGGDYENMWVNVNCNGAAPPTAPFTIQNSIVYQVYEDTDYTCTGTSFAVYTETFGLCVKSESESGSIWIVSVFNPTTEHISMYFYSDAGCTTRLNYPLTYYQAPKENVCGPSASGSGGPFLNSNIIATYVLTEGSAPAVPLTIPNKAVIYNFPTMDACTAGISGGMTNVNIILAITVGSQCWSTGYGKSEMFSCSTTPGYTGVNIMNFDGANCAGTMTASNITATASGCGPSTFGGYGFSSAVCSSTTLTPTVSPTVGPSPVPTVAPTAIPTFNPTVDPSPVPTVAPTAIPTWRPTEVTVAPTPLPTVTPGQPTAVPTLSTDIITNTIVVDYYSTLDTTCSGLILETREQTLGLCEPSYDASLGAYIRIMKMGSNWTIMFYSDAFCRVSAASTPTTFGILQNTCTNNLSPSSQAWKLIGQEGSSYMKATLVASTNTAQIAPATSMPPIKGIFPYATVSWYDTTESCKAKSKTNVIETNYIKVGVCMPYDVFGNGVGTTPTARSIMVNCKQPQGVSNGMVGWSYTDTACKEGKQSFTSQPWVADSTQPFVYGIYNWNIPACQYYSNSNFYVTVTCDPTLQESKSNNNNSGDSKSGGAGGAIGGAIGGVAFLIMLYYLYSLRQKANAAREAAQFAGNDSVSKGENINPIQNGLMSQAGRDSIPEHLRESKASKLPSIKSAADEL